MFIAALFIIAQTLERTQTFTCRCMDKEMVIQAYGATLPNYKKMSYCYTQATWMNIRINIPNKRGQTKRVQLYNYIYATLWKVQTNLQWRNADELLPRHSMDRKGFQGGVSKVWVTGVLITLIWVMVSLMCTYFRTFKMMHCQYMYYCSQLYLSKFVF